MKRYLVAGATIMVALALTGCTQNSVNDPVAPVTVQPTITAAPRVTTDPTGIPTPDAPSPSFPMASPTAAPSATSTPSAAPAVDRRTKRALDQLSKLKVQEANYSIQYNRTKDFGPAWEDVDHNGCDTRNDILRRDLTGITYRSDDPGCTVATGRLADPYTGTTINFVRGQGTSLAIQIDHMVPLHYAWMHGAASWSQAERENYANDPYILLAVDGPANGQKSDKGPADWLPQKSYQCEYVAHFIGVEAKYDLTISRRDAAASRNVLSTCS